MRSAVLGPCAADPPVSPARLVARTVWLEIVRREEYMALAILMGLFLCFAAAARAVGATGAESACFLLNMGLAASATLSSVLAVLVSARMLPGEIERRTLYPLLAKPLERHELLLGKFLAATLAGWGALFCFTGATWTLVPHLPIHQTPVAFQALALQLLSLALLCAVAMWLSLLLPQSVAALLALGLYFGGSAAAALLRVPARGSWLEPVLSWIAGYLPNFTVLSLFTRYTDGGPPLPWSQWISALVYGAGATLFFLLLAVTHFQRRAL